jgi:hypothetical protein
VGVWPHQLIKQCATHLKPPALGMVQCRELFGSHFSTNKEHDIPQAMSFGPRRRLSLLGFMPVSFVLILRPLKIAKQVDRSAGDSDRDDPKKQEALISNKIQDDQWREIPPRMLFQLSG